MNPAISSIVDLLQGRQHNRILRLAYPHNDAPTSQFLVHQIDAVESLSRDFEFTVELLCEDPNVPLKDMHGKLLSIELVRGDGSLRYFTGYVFSFKRKKSDGNITFYEAKLGPWLKYLSLRKDNYLFHGLNLREQADSIFADYGAYPSWDWRVAGDDLAMTDAYQFDETDFNYLSRRWEAAGYLYWYEHDAEGHKLVVSDDSTAAAPIDGTAEVRFQRHGGVADEDAVDVWSPIRTTAPSSVGLSSFNFKHSRPTEVSVTTLANQGKVPAVESYEYTGAYGCKSADDGDQLGHCRMEEFEGSSKHVDAEGNNRYVLPGRYLTLVDHFSYFSMSEQDASNTEFLILSVHHSASNNYFQESELAPHYRNSMTCTRKSVKWRPGRGYNSINTKILAPQTATVVGPSGPDSIHTDEYGRIRVQFHWDRIGNRDERSSAWVRVTSLWAGAELGTAAIPRVGSEVIVQWLDGNPDRPIITGAVYNELNMPPWELNSQQALMGLRSRELAPNGGNAASGRSNHLILDDTNTKIQAQLKSDHQCSQLSLGNIARIEDTTGRKDARGEGWEIASNAWGVARAGKGMLITTEARNNVASHAKDMGETVQRLNAARQEQEAQAKLAEQHGAQDTKDQQGSVAKSLSDQNNGIKGELAKTDTDRFPELAEPHLILASSAGIATTTTQSTHIASAEHTAITTGKNISIAAGDSLLASIRQTFRLFVHKAGMKLIAAAGDIDINALSNSINLLAKLNITQTGKRITITAEDEIVINGAGSYGKFSAGGIEFGTRTTFRVRATLKQFESGNFLPIKPLELPIVDGFDEQFRLVNDKDEALPHCPYTIRSSCGKVWEGTSDSNGMTQRVFTEHPASLSVEVSTGKQEPTKFSHDMFFQVNDKLTGKPLANTNYQIKLESGKSYTGMTDEKGHTEIVQSNKPEIATIEVPYYGDIADNAHSDRGSDPCSC